MKLAIKEILITIIFVWLLGMISAYFHWKKTTDFIKGMQNNYIGYLGMGIGRVNFLRKVMVITIADKNGDICECQYLYGWSVFTDFRQKKELLGKNMNQVIKDMKNDKFYSAIEISIAKIKEQIRMDDYHVK